MTKFEKSKYTLIKAQNAPIHRGETRKSLKATCQHPRSTPVEVKTTLSKTIFKGQRESATALTAFTSASI
jgi:hypothetical protein